MIQLETLPLSKLSDPNLPAAVFAFEDAGLAGARHLNAGARKRLLEAAKAEGFKGKPGECCPLSWEGRRLIVVGLGRRKGYSREAQRRAAGKLWAFAKSRHERLALWPEDWLGAAQGLLLGSYRFCEYKKEDPDKLTEVFLATASAAEQRAARRALEQARLEADAVCLVRDLVNRGPSDKTPQSLAELAKSFAGLSVEVIDKEQARKLGMGALLGVSRGSSVDPALIHLSYKPKNAKKRVGLVGKGIIFDSGGLSLKPPQHMETMKGDMAGAASVLAVMRALPRLKPKVEVHGYCACAYNMPGPDALKPGDVVRALNGKTIEVLNTDAEGRLVLADALSYAAREKLDAVIDLATLTGAVVVALGSKVTGAMGDRSLLARLAASSRRCEEPFCELPLFEDYAEQIKSSIADVQNIGKVRGEGGSIIGGLFLREFAGEAPWVHLDIAGTAWNDQPSAYCPAGGTGSLVRTLLDYLAGL
ncbi:MAG: leucyl aminopeptidase [Elusimicrobia bacterium]|nr:leucyl aminopeptidase [Elusimicrobiota bacterium]MDE2237046.1 leucyl aminopeptidase [Elusimicrobiota bacterium]MDE2425894.1 leucyl aminopeptidase [Elusimicrobiota bacterium]